HIISDSFFSNTLSNVCKTLSNNPKDSIQGRYIKNKKTLLLFTIILCNFNLSLTAQTEATVTGNTNTLVNIPDNNSGGVSATVDFSEIPSHANLTGIELSLSINHNNAGDLKMFLKSPTGLQMTLVNRPSETFSDGETIYSPANLDDNYPISFSDNAIYSAEIMGGNGTVVFPRLSSNEVICESNNICEFYPDDDGSNNPDTFASFMTSVNNVSGVSGEWEVIIIDSVSGTSGNFLIENIELAYEYFTLPVVNCVDNLTATLDSFGEWILDDPDLLYTAEGQYIITFSPDPFFDCGDIGREIEITVEARDPETDLIGTCQSTITVEAPPLTLTCPPDMTFYAVAGGSVAVDYNQPVITVQTDCSVAPLIQTSGFVSGALVSAGTYTYSFETEGYGDEVYNCSFNVTVENLPETSIELINGKLTITDIESESSDQITFSSDGTTLTISDLIDPSVSGGPTLVDPTTVTVPLASITNGIVFNAGNGGNTGFNIITFANDLTLTGVDNDITLNGLRGYVQTGSINIEGDLTINGVGFGLTLFGFDLTLGEITANNLTIDGVDRILDQELALTISGVTQLQAGDGINIENGQGRHTFGDEVHLTSGELIFSAGANTTFGEINATDQGVGLPHTFTVAPGDIAFNGDVTILGSNANLFVCSLNNISQTGGIIETPFLIFRGNGNTTATIDNNNNIGALGTSNPFDANAVDLASLSFTNTSNMFLEIIDVDEFNLTAPQFDFEPDFTNITKRGSGVSNFNADIDMNNGTGTAIINHNAGTINFNGDTNDFLSQMTYIGQPGTITNINSVTTSFPFAGTNRGFTFGTLNATGAIDAGDIDINLSDGANFSLNTTSLTGVPYLQGALTTISGGAKITPGGGTTGLEYSFDDLIMDSGATFAPLVEGTGGSEFDELVVNGTVTLNDANLSPIGGYVIGSDDELIIINNNSIGPVIGTFNGLPEGSEVIFGDFEGIISYTGGDGNDVVLRPDNVAPIAVCQDITLNIDLTGITVTGDQLDGGSTDNVGITEILIDGETSLDFTIDDIGDHEVTITFVDNNGNTADCMATITLNSTVTLPILISEYQPQIASSLQALEIKGEPGEAFVGTFVVIEGDTDSGTTGIVKSTTSFSTNFNTNGLIVATLPNIEDPTHTVVLTSSFNGTVDVTDIDTDDDGVADDLSSFGVIFDAVGVSDGGACCPEGVRYGTDFGGINLPNIGSVPGAIFREGSDGDFYQISFSTGDLYDNTATIVDASSFNTTPTLAGTFGSINPIRLSVDCDNHTTW
ncbi:hypothetical protein, partial [Dokdonia sp.]|uniref:beta strand repeat-containing protein n=1 Tax=Dokdonia sp. TaxID=2024995 RepID=UPI0032644EED